MRVVAAVIIKDGRIFAAQRNAFGPLAGKWEFPGGKIKEGESPVCALKREIREELGIEIEVHSPFLTVDHSYPTFDITLESYRCSLTEGTITLNEHLSCGWFSLEELERLDWAAADLPIVSHLGRELG
ncbi:MAG: CTP pyrophosphohydrolase [Spirochaetes bacterium ADurb.Bin315]|jgi:8-oxo-dGTP diphosphatase|nr:(deoxy)nucleoside triphosphate pyrophosphohydrolase [Spirochaetota bacterium]OQA42763.1 MAG: CTP pyrophosphohydrolase [Spirochaetes bacterium ADurb.Bin315]HOE90249.1 (deoxy)nucleoside triphosphate pyrophosphohydrolase [Sphaerochaeta sp.]HPB42284.1 (deoxy)nucleoside triphosphate pyrophosphohydrolase [Sphaerochaeta sp.]HPY45424.1 (deoxy)nucleoside triphosphate pyrophosphohydrolase [Sphaerochaeta sp.]